MRHLLICRQASASEIISNLVVAMEARKSGSEIGVLFTEEALVALCQGVFDWPRQLNGQALRLAMADNAAALGLPAMGGKGEARQVDVRQLISKAIQAGIPVFAGEFWLKLSGLQDKLPEGVKVLRLAETVAGVKELNS